MVCAAETLQNALPRKGTALLSDAIVHWMLRRKKYKTVFGL